MNDVATSDRVVNRHMALIAALWIVTRLAPLLVAVPWTYWEVWQVQKLAQYGFMARAGALLDWSSMTGLVANPAAHNYVNHPYPILWVYFLLFKLGGGVAVVAANALVGLCTTLLTYRVLARWFGPASALPAAVLYLAAPTSLFFDVDPNIIALASWAWPVSAWLVQRSSKPWTLGLTMFAAHLTSWLAVLMFPAVVVLANGKEDRWKWIGWAAAGTAGAMAWMGFQVLYYSPALGVVLHYVSGQSGWSSGLPSFATGIRVVVAKAIVLAGPALGLAAGVAIARGTRDTNPATKAALVYLVCFALGALLLNHHFAIERSMYEGLVFPLAALGASQWHRMPRLVRPCIALLATVFLAMALVQCFVPRVSTTSSALGNWLREQTGPSDAIASALVPQRPPFADWDVGSVNYMALIADRRILTPVEGGAAFLLTTGMADTSGAWQPVGQLVLPPENGKRPLGIRARDLYWRLRGDVAYAAPMQGATTVTLYRATSHEH